MFRAVIEFVYYVDIIIVYGVVRGLAYSASVESPGVSWQANAGSPTSDAIAKAAPRTRSLILKIMSYKYSQKTLTLQQTETVCYMMDVPETLPQDSNLGRINSPGARTGAFPSSKFVLDQYIKYLCMTLNASSGTKTPAGTVTKSLQNPQKSAIFGLILVLGVSPRFRPCPVIPGQQTGPFAKIKICMRGRPQNVSKSI